MKTSSDSINVYASATVTNVACGFDSLGFAINEPGEDLLKNASKYL